MKLDVRPLTLADKDAFYEGLETYAGDGLDWYSFAWQPGMTFEGMLQILADEAQGLNLAPDRVAHTMLYAFSLGKIIGRVSIRHELNEHLFERGGNVGYWIGTPHRGFGLATPMIRAGLEYCRNELGMKKLLLTCSDQNEISWRLIEKFGGALENKIWDSAKNEHVRRYWLTL